MNLQNDEAKKKNAKIKRSLKTQKKIAENTEKTEKKENNDLLPKIVSLIITAFVASLIVGGGIYLWQKSNTKKNIDEVIKEKENIVMSFEERLLDLKNKLKGIEDENSELKNINENLKSKVGFLDGAKIKFTSPELGLSFQYPALLGEVKMVIKDGETGKMFAGTFAGNDKLVFGGASEDFTRSESDTEDAFLDNCGFKTRRGTYYFKFVNQGKVEDYEIEPSNIIELKNSQALIVDKSNFIAGDDGNIKEFDLGDSIGAIINLDMEDFKGVAFINKDFNKMNKSEFEEMIKSMEIK